VDGDNESGLKAISQHYVQNSFYEGICLGGHPQNIQGISPGEPLHVIDLGLFKGCTLGFMVNLGHKPQTKSYPKILVEVNNWALAHQSDHKLPRTYFPKGIMGGTKLAEHEITGVLLVMLIMCNMELSIAHLLSSHTFQEHHVRGWIHLLELLLTYRWWLKFEEVPLEESRNLLCVTKDVLCKYKQVIRTKHGMKDNKIKFYISIHTPAKQEEFGMMANVNSGPMESNHKTNGKWPGNRT
jgi:hypothetical protein